MRRARKVTAVVVSAALMGAGSLLAAAPAHANTTVSAGCPSGGITVEIDPVPLTTLTVTGIENCATIYVAKSTVGDPIPINAVTFTNGNVRSGDPLPQGSDWEWGVSWTGPGSVDVDIASGVSTTPGSTLLYGNAGGGLFFYVKVRSASPSPTPQPSSNTATSAPTAWIQQFGMPASGSCEDAAPADLNTAGVGSGGWGTSWAQWMNGGTGGAVCTRTLSYVGSSWTVS